MHHGLLVAYFTQNAVIIPILNEEHIRVVISMFHHVGEVGSIFTFSSRFAKKS